jgi:hypothetical protein
MAAALLFWQMTDLLHLSNYTRRFIVKLKPDEALGNHRRQPQQSRLELATPD